MPNPVHLQLDRLGDIMTNQLEPGMHVFQQLPWPGDEDSPGETLRIGALDARGNRSELELAWGGDALLAEGLKIHIETSGAYPLTGTWHWISERTPLGVVLSFLCAWLRVVSHFITSRMLCDCMCVSCCFVFIFSNMEMLGFM